MGTTQKQQREQMERIKQAERRINNTSLTFYTIATFVIATLIIYNIYKF